MKRFQYLISASIVSLLYNVFILFSVSMNMEWVRTRAAGGQYENFPIWIRILYFVMASFMGSLIFWLWDHRYGVVEGRSKTFAKGLSYLFIISTLLQLISRSADERWNAIPASILAITFWVLVRRNSR